MPMFDDIILGRCRKQYPRGLCGGDGSRYDHAKRVTSGGDKHHDLVREHYQFN
jgi:hypothetical protein